MPAAKSHEDLPSYVRRGEGKVGNDFAVSKRVAGNRIVPAHREVDMAMKRRDAIVDRRALRRVADRDAAGPQGLQGSRRRPATFPSDTISTHLIHPPGVAALEALGPARPGRRDGLPADRHLRVRLRVRSRSRVAPGTRTAPPRATRPRRTVLDKLLVDAARRGRRRGARGVHRRRSDPRGRPRHRHPRSRQGRPDRHRARARRRSAPTAATRSSRKRSTAPYHEKPPLLAGYYTYWSGLPMNGRFEAYVRTDRGFAAGRPTTA